MLLPKGSPDRGVTGKLDDPDHDRTRTSRVANTYERLPLTPDKGLADKAFRVLGLVSR